MLTRTQSIVGFVRGEVRPDRLQRRRDARYLGHAESMLEVYGSGTGLTRGALHERVGEVLGRDANASTVRAAAFCKLLDEESEFETDRDGTAWRTRLLVFALAARYSPLTAERRPVVVDRIARRVGRPWETIVRDMRRDRPGEATLLGGPVGMDAADLLARYNVAQIQAALYDATSLRLEVTADLKPVVRLVKLAGLLHDVVAREEGGYRIDVAGPASVLRRTHAYGARMACLVPGLLACRGWRLYAHVRDRAGRGGVLRLGPEDGYRSPNPKPPAFDSALERRFAKAFGGRRAGWELLREATLLFDNQRVFLPDFTLRRDDGSVVHLEIVGYWTPEYLAKKAMTLARFASSRLLVALPLAVLAGAPPPRGVVGYRRALRPEDVLEALARLG